MSDRIFGTMLRWAFLICLGAVAVTAWGCAAPQNGQNAQKELPVQQPQEKFAISRYDKLPAGAYAVVAEIRAKAGKENELRAATLPLVEAVRNEPNNLLYFLHEDREAPGHFIFYEIFATQADFEAHNKTPHVQAWFAKLPELAAGDVKVIRMEILGNAPASPK